MASVDVMFESELLCPSLLKNIVVFGKEYSDEGFPLLSFLQHPITASPFLTVRNL
jgi:hypothetical protein